MKINFYYKIKYQQCHCGLRPAICNTSLWDSAMAKMWFCFNKPK